MPAAIPVAAGEAAIAMGTQAAAEMAAIEAAKIAAAEAAAQAAAQAAATAATETAATAAANTAASTAANTAMNQGILQAIGTGAPNVASGITGVGAGAGATPFSAAEVEAISRGVDIARNAPVIEQTAGLQNASMMNAPAAQAVQAAPPVNGAYQFASAPPAPTPAAPNVLSGTYQAAPPQPITGPNFMSPQTIANAGGAEPSSMLERGFNKALDFIKDSPFSAASMGLNAMQLLNKKETPEKEEYNGILTKYKMSPDFQGQHADPADYQYTPKVYNGAQGGIMQAYAGGGPVEMMSNANAVGANTGYPMADINKGAYATPYQTPISRNVLMGSADTGVNPMTGEMQFARGGIASYNDGGKAATAYYERMTKPKEAPIADKKDVGIYYDLDPDTRYQDALSAAIIRQSKVNKRANMQMPSMKRPTPMGQINLSPPGSKGRKNEDVAEAAQGGIMGLGGYAAGGNPRLLKGPGDGMSDNIPATIAGKQPARLADGEFVIPADVVSHLGNGSTEAGAKKLHRMMTQVRKARTGNPKQGKQINPNKFMPK